MRHGVVSYIVIAAGALLLLISPFIERRMGAPVFSETAGKAATVVIDPGHGGEDGGATGITGTLEKGINLSISRKLRALLNFYGIDTLMTRDEDVSIHDMGNSVRRRKISDMKNRVKLVNKCDDPVLLSVHLNFYPQESCRGAQVFYSAGNPDSKTLADAVQASLKIGMSDGNRRETKLAEKSIYLLNQVRCPAILTECGFLSNPNEESLLVTEEYQTKLAACIAAGYLQFNREQDGDK